MDYQHLHSDGITDGCGFESFFLSFLLYFGLQPSVCWSIHSPKGHFFPFLFPPSLCLKVCSISIKGVVSIFGGPCLIPGIGSNPLQLHWEWTWELWVGIWTLFLSVFLFQTSSSFFVAEASVSLASLSPVSWENYSPVSPVVSMECLAACALYCLPSGGYTSLILIHLLIYFSQNIYNIASFLFLLDLPDFGGVFVCYSALFCFVLWSDISIPK